MLTHLEQFIRETLAKEHKLNGKETDKTLLDVEDLLEVLMEPGNHWLSVMIGKRLQRYGRSSSLMLLQEQGSGANQITARA